MRTNNLRRRYGTWLIRLWLGLLAGGVGTERTTAQTTAPATNAPADAPVRVRYPAADRLRELQTDRDYQYGRDAPPPDNALGRFWTWLMRKLFRFLSSPAYQNVWQYILLAAIAGLAIYLLLKAEVLSFGFLKRAQTNPLDYETGQENIHAIDFGAAIEEATRLSNYRLAVRLLYLQTLKRLTDAGLIQYQPDKTNRQYVYELKNAPQRTEFDGLTRQFEYVWYGNFPVDAGRFNAIRQQFRTFNSPTAAPIH